MTKSKKCHVYLMTTELQPYIKWDNVHSDDLNVLDCAH